jgi:large subunit ribosomal protein L17
MRHAVRGRKLGRTFSHRKALVRNQIGSLFLHDRIRTTLTKAKEMRPIAEKLVTLARRGGTPAEVVHARRLATARLSDEVAVRRLFDKIAPRFKERPGGYTRILKLGKMRKGDNAELAILEFVDYVFEPKEKREGAKKGATPEPAPEKKGKAAPKKKAAKADEKGEKKEAEKEPAAKAPKKKAAPKAAPKSVAGEAKKPAAKKSTKKKESE